MAIKMCTAQLPCAWLQAYCAAGIPEICSQVAPPRLGPQQPSQHTDVDARTWACQKIWSLTCSTAAAAAGVVGDISSGRASMGPHWGDAEAMAFRAACTMAAAAKDFWPREASSSSASAGRHSSAECWDTAWCWICNGYAIAAGNQGHCLCTAAPIQVQSELSQSQLCPQGMV